MNGSDIENQANSAGREGKGKVSNNPKQLCTVLLKPTLLTRSWGKARAGCIRGCTVRFVLLWK